MKLCTDCAHYQRGKERFLYSVPDECNHPDNMLTNPVNGKIVNSSDRPFHLRTLMGRCGPEARLFSPIVPRQKPSADEQWDIDTDGVKVGSKLWNARGWFVVKRVEYSPAPYGGKVWVRPEAPTK